MMFGTPQYHGGMAEKEGLTRHPTTPSSLGPNSPHSPPSPSYSDAAPTSPLSPGGSKGPKACGVCGDIAKSMHFGGLSCDSCKAFFRRSVQNNAYKGFTCPYEKKCVIAVSSRKACQYCRFEKCLIIGMEKGWVMTEDERRKMMLQRQEKKQQQQKQEQENRVAQEKKVAMYSLSEEDRSEISVIVNLYQKAYKDIPYVEETTADTLAVMNPWMTFCKRMGYFFSLFREFSNLSSSDQALLLKTAITSACIIMGSVVYDSSTGKWPGKSISRTGFIPKNVTTQNVGRLVPADLFSRVESFFKKFQQICPDETMAMILILVTLYSPELIGLEAKDTIQSLQDRYIHILQRYVKWKFREKSYLMFPKVIVSLADIRELAERTAQMRIQAGSLSSRSFGAESGGLSFNFSGAVGGSQMFGSSSGEYSTMVESSRSIQQSGHGGVHIKVEEGTDGDVVPQCNDMVKTVSRADIGSGDQAYQRLMQKVMDQLIASSIHLRAPSLLPFITQIVQKIGAETNGGLDDRVIATTSSNVKHRRHHHHHRTHRGTKKRIVEIKKEEEEMDIERSGYEAGSVFDVPQTVASSSIAHSMGPNSTMMEKEMGTGMNPYRLHQAHQSSHLSLFQQQSFPEGSYALEPGPTLAQTPGTSPSPGVCQSAFEVGSSDVLSSSSIVGSPSVSQSHVSHMSPGHPHGAGAPSQMTPPHMIRSGLPGSHPITGSPVQSPPIQMPPVAPYTPTTTPQSHIAPPQISPSPPDMSPSPDLGSMLSQDAAFQYQQRPSPVPALSPYSDSSNSSSSSQEDSQSARSEIFSEDLSDIEIDVLTQLLECISSVDNLDNINSLKEVLPPHLLTELQSKLCSLNQ
ncbi:uncharacterized protein LOC143019304 isoform X2 [Oratosquilla oratoria]